MSVSRPDAASKRRRRVRPEDEKPVDAQITYRIPTAKASIKFGGSNIFNSNYIQYAGGPTLGGLYYAAITFDGLLTK